MGTTEQLIQDLKEMLQQHQSPNKALWQARNNLLERADEHLRDSRRFQGDDPLKITDWICEGEIGPEPNTREVFFCIGELLEDSGALESLGTVMFRCDNGKAYEMIVCGQIREVTEKAVAEVIENLCDHERFLVTRDRGNFYVTDRVTGKRTRAKAGGHESMKSWQEFLNTNHEATLRNHFP